MLTKGIASFDGDESTNLRAMCDPNDTWNGWAKPYINADDIDKFISLVAWSDEDGDGHYYEKQGNSVYTKSVHYGELEHEDVIEPTEIEGEMWYYMGDEGLIFDFEQNANDLKIQLESRYDFKTEVFYLSDTYGSEYQVTYKQGLQGDEISIEKDGYLIDNESQLGIYIRTICEENR